MSGMPQLLTTLNARFQIAVPGSTILLFTERGKAMICEMKSRECFAAVQRRGEVGVRISIKTQVPLKNFLADEHADSCAHSEKSTERHFETEILALQLDDRQSDNRPGY